MRLFDLAVGVAVGYSVGRVLEARANGVPVDIAFRRPFTSTRQLRDELERAATEFRQQVLGQGGPQMSTVASGQSMLLPPPVPQTLTRVPGTSNLIVQPGASRAAAGEAAVAAMMQADPHAADWLLGR